MPNFMEALFCVRLNHDHQIPTRFSRTRRKSCPVYSSESRWRHQREAFSVLLALCERNPPVTGGFPSKRPATWSFDVFFDLRLNKRLSKQSRRRWFEMASRSLWRHCNDTPLKLNDIPSWSMAVCHNDTCEKPHFLDIRNISFRTSEITYKYNNAIQAISKEKLLIV